MCNTRDQIKKRRQSVKNILKDKEKKIHFFGFMSGLSLANVFLMYAGVFYFSAWMMANDKIASNNFGDIYKVLFAIMFAAMTAGQGGALAPDYG